MTHIVLNCAELGRYSRVFYSMLFVSTECLNPCFKKKFLFVFFTLFICGVVKHHKKQLFAYQGLYTFSRIFLSTFKTYFYDFPAY